MDNANMSETENHESQKTSIPNCGMLAVLCILVAVGLFMAYGEYQMRYAEACFSMCQIHRVTTQPEVWDVVEWHGSIIERAEDPKSFRRIIEALRTVRVSRLPAIRNQPVLLSLYFYERGEHGRQQILYLNGRFLRYRQATELIEKVMAEKRQDQQTPKTG